MVFCDYGKQMLAIRLGSNIDFARCCAVGTGSAIEQASDKILNDEWDYAAGARLMVGSVDYSVNKKITFITDWNSVQISGCQLKEFGLFMSGTTNTGSLFLRQAFPNISFDGTNEARVEITIELF